MITLNDITELSPGYPGTHTANSKSRIITLNSRSWASVWFTYRLRERVHVYNLEGCKWLNLNKMNIRHYRGRQRYFSGHETSVKFVILILTNWMH